MYDFTFKYTKLAVYFVADMVVADIDFRVADMFLCCGRCRLAVVDQSINQSINQEFLKWPK